MKLNYSKTKSAQAQRKRRMMHPVAVAMDKIHWLQDPVNKEKQRMWEKAWREQNLTYRREYQRLTKAIIKARKSNDAALEGKLLVERRLHCMSLPNRKTTGNMQPLEPLS